MTFSPAGPSNKAENRFWLWAPASCISFSQNTHLFLNAYFETLVHNRPQGDFFVLRLVHHF